MFDLDNDATAYIILFLICCFIFSLFFILVKPNKKTKEQVAKEEAELIDESPDEPPLEEIHVEIILKQCGVSVYGIKTPQCASEFFITFLADDGTEITYPVSEEVYLELEENQKGTLAIVNNNFYGFCPDDEEI
ncbi:MAG: hypothetical protein IJW65_00400 [Clostridia bacterium]|nr:hypothetical protein [Clostridia bacterium]